MAFANIARYEKDAKTGKYALDQDGEVMIGWYYQMMEDEDTPLSSPMGPYSSYDRAEEECMKAWNAQELV